MATTALCTLSNVQNLLSSAGVTLRIDDVPPTSADGDVIDDASQIIYEHFLLSYTEANLAASQWVKKACALVAAVYLCERRGNPCPIGLAGRYDRFLKRFEEGRLGRFNIPDIPGRAQNAPQLVNGRVVLAPVPHFRVETGRSTSAPVSFSEKTDRADPIDFIP